jgi:FkbM family methyltransferase
MSAKAVQDKQPESAKARLQRMPESVRWAMRLAFISPLRAYFRYFPSHPGKKAVWRKTAAHLWWLETHVKATTIFDSVLVVDAEDIVGKYIYYFGIWEPNLTNWITQRLKPGDVFVDVGANIGYFSSLASKLVGDSGKVVSIEALPQIFNRLKGNLEMNSARNVRLANVAVWHQDEQVKMFSQSEHPSGTTSLMPAWADQWQLKTISEVSARPLPSILTPEEIKTVRLIKIDVEGAEWNVVTGMASMMSTCRQEVEIIMEVSRSMLAVHGKTPQDLVDLFSSWGFHPYRVVNDYSAMAYVGRGTPIQPKRIEQIFDGKDDQTDVIFSRVDSGTL